MKVTVYNSSGSEVDAIDLPSDIFEAKVNRDLMHQALVRQQSNRRLGTHKTKGRSEINRTGAKLYRQKGTGNARHGSKRAPIFVGGGVAHGPRPRKYTKKMPQKMHQAALRSALTVKAESEAIVVVDQFGIEQPKTKDMVRLLTNLQSDNSTLLLLPEKDEAIEKSARNLSNVKTILVNYINVRDLLGHDKIVMPVEAVGVLESWLGRSSAPTALETSEEEE